MSATISPVLNQLVDNTFTGLLAQTDTFLLEQIPTETSLWVFTLIAVPILVVGFFLTVFFSRNTSIFVMLAFATVAVLSMIMIDTNDKNNQADAIRSQLAQRTSAQVVEVQWDHKKVAVLSTQPENTITVCELEQVNSTVVVKCDNPVPPPNGN